MTDTHLTAATRFVEADGNKFAYRRWGNSTTGQPPLFFLQHFRGGMDHWDPLMTDGLAAGREVTFAISPVRRAIRATRAAARFLQRRRRNETLARRLPGGHP